VAAPDSGRPPAPRQGEVVAWVAANYQARQIDGITIYNLS